MSNIRTDAVAAILKRVAIERLRLLQAEAIIACAAEVAGDKEVNGVDLRSALEGAQAILGSVWGALDEVNLKAVNHG